MPSLLSQSQEIPSVGFREAKSGLMRWTAVKPWLADSETYDAEHGSPGLDSGDVQAGGQSSLG